jgi:transposase-like protein
MRGRKRPMAERARAVGVALLDGASEASRKTGLPESTIRQWMGRPEFAELRERTKEAVAEEWWAGVQHGFRRVIEAFDEEADVQKKATAAAILFDKIALMRGDVTSRSEVSTFHGYNDHEKRAIADLLREALAADGAEGGPAGDADGDAMVGIGAPGADSPVG